MLLSLISCKDVHAHRAISACNNDIRNWVWRRDIGVCPLQHVRFAREVKRPLGICVLRNCWLDYTSKGQEVLSYAASVRSVWLQRAPLHHSLDLPTCTCKTVSKVTRLKNRKCSFMQPRSDKRQITAGAAVSHYRLLNLPMAKLLARYTIYCRDKQLSDKFLVKNFEGFHCVHGSSRLHPVLRQMAHVHVDPLRNLCACSAVPNRLFRRKESWT